MEKVIEFFKEKGIYNEEFFNYIKKKVLILPSDTPLEWFGCFPILDENNNIMDIRLSVPEVVTEKNLLVNLHEYYHAYEIYNELGNLYIENREVRENNAINFEQSYILSRKLKNE